MGTRAIRRVVLVVITVLVIVVIVLLVAIIMVIVIARLVILCILGLGVAVLIIVVIALIIVAIVVVVILRALLIVGIALLSIGRLEVIFESAYEAFKIFWDVGSMMWARDTAMCIFVVFMAPEEFFRIAELDSRIGVELELSTEETRFCVLNEFA